MATRWLGKFAQVLRQPSGATVWISGIGLASGMGYLFYTQRDSGLARESSSLKTHTVIVTGADKGLGFDVALALAKRRARVIMACRDTENCRLVRRDVVNKSGNKRVACRALDLSSIDSVKAFAKRMSEEEQPSALVNNAGTMVPKQLATADGLELHLGVNHMGPALLTQLLRPALEASPLGGRVVSVSCIGAKATDLDPADLNAERVWAEGGKMADITAYKRSKLAAQLWALSYARRLQAEGSKVTVNVIEAGMMRSQLERYQWWWNTNWRSKVWNILRFFTHHKCSDGAARVVHLATASSMDGITGQYFEKLKLADPHASASDLELCAWVDATTDAWTRLPAVRAALGNPGLADVPIRELAPLLSPEARGAAKEGWVDWTGKKLHVW